MMKKTQERGSISKLKMRTFVNKDIMLNNVNSGKN
jgi:hypothetical protein